MICLNKVCKKYVDVKTVDIEQLKINKGEIFGFLGPNGAGKTTTIKMLVGLLNITEGSILINGYDIKKEPKEAKRMFSYIPDIPNLYEKLTGREFIRFIANLYGIRQSSSLEDDIEKILIKLELENKGDSLIETYSHGMKQKIQVASALIHKPEVLILDEPFVGLDPSGVKILKDILREYSSYEKTVFISTHVLDIVENLCDRIAIIKKGKIKFVGTISELNEIQGNNTLEDNFLELTKSTK
jgi:ABC-2 type transport system ATP-binding protein